MKKILHVFVLCALSCSLSVYAAGSSSWDVEKDGDIDKADIAKIDKNGDGKVTLAEAKAAGVSEADFKKADSNGDGTVSAEELAKLYTGG